MTTAALTGILPAGRDTGSGAGAGARADSGAGAGSGAGFRTGAGTVQLRTADGWFPVCPAEVLEAGRGVAVLLPGGAQAALFRDRTGALYAIGNVDPFTGAGVLCHGLLGSADGRPYVASPLLKQRFDLADGRCLDGDGVRVAVYGVRVVAPAG